MIYSSPFPDASIPEISLVEFVFANAGSHADKPALIDGKTGRVVSYGRLGDEIRTVARRLAEGGVRRGDVVAIFGPNSPEYVTAFYGLTMLGACVTTLNPLHNIAELSYQLKDSAANALITTSPATETVVAAAKQAGIARVFDVQPLTRIPSAARPSSGLCSEVDVHRDIATLTYSNVATDVPMGVMLSHYNLVANVAQTWSVEPIQADEVRVGLRSSSRSSRMPPANGRATLGFIATLPS